MCFHHACDFVMSIDSQNTCDVYNVDSQNTCDVCEVDRQSEYLDMFDDDR